MKKIKKYYSAMRKETLFVEYNNDEYFSITAVLIAGDTKESTDKPSKVHDNRWIACGCQHDEIKAFAGTEFNALIDLHLSDLQGVPMYAFENGKYYVEIALGIAKYHKPEDGDAAKYIKVIAKHLRISVVQAGDLVISMNGLSDMDRMILFAEFVKSQIPRWNEEARIATIKYFSE